MTLNKTKHRFQINFLMITILDEYVQLLIHSYHIVLKMELIPPGSFHDRSWSIFCQNKKRLVTPAFRNGLWNWLVNKGTNVVECDWNILNFRGSIFLPRCENLCSQRNSCGNIFLNRIHALFLPWQELLLQMLTFVRCFIFESIKIPSKAMV